MNAVFRNDLHTAAFLSALAAVAALPVGAHAAASVQSCGALAQVALPGATITAATMVAEGQYQFPDGVEAGNFVKMSRRSGMNVAGHVTDGANPAFCRVAATLKPTSDSDIKVEIWLPMTGWNGKMLALGNFGWAGQVMLAGMLAGVQEHYASISTDTGHDASTPQGHLGMFAVGHPQKLIDYAYRADHLMTVDAKMVIKAAYGSMPAHSYWIGCSLGGVEALIEAKRYPADYDGIVAGAPPNPIVNFNAEQLWSGWLTNRNPGLRMPAAKFTMLADAVAKGCGTPVGLAQGFIEQPDKCTVEPRQLQCKGAETPDCLTANQVSLIDRIYQGPVNPRTHQVIFPGPAKGNEAQFAESADGRPFPVALDMFYVALDNPHWDWTTLNWDTDVDAAIAKIGPLMHVDADLRPFFRKGGKLLMYIGWNDGHNPAQLEGYYEQVMHTAGDTTRASARLFTIPGMNHCMGGNGCDTFNKLGVIDSWVSSGKAPERIIASKVTDGKVVRTRPLCAYPAAAKYDGTGDMASAASFTCAGS